MSLRKQQRISGVETPRERSKPYEDGCVSDRAKITEREKERPALPWSKITV
jgi:hypothetical protein